MGDQGPIGRIALLRVIGLGEGATRTIVKHLTNAKIISIVKNGCVLAKRANSIYRELRSKLSKSFIIDANQLALDKASAAILVRGFARQLKNGIEQ